MICDSLGNMTFLLLLHLQMIGEVHALSVDRDCLLWTSDGSGVTLLMCLDSGCLMLCLYVMEATEKVTPCLSRGSQTGW